MSNANLLLTTKDDLVVFDELEQRSKEWFKVRGGMLTASIVKDIMKPRGLGKPGNDLAIKLAYQTLGVDPQEEHNTSSIDMINGVEREPIAVEKYEEKEMVDVLSVGFVYRKLTLKNKKGQTLTIKTGCSPDGLVPDLSRGLEVKCPNIKTQKRNFMAEGVYQDYIDQIQHCLFVTGLESWDFVSFNPLFEEPFNFVKHTVYVDKNWQSVFLARLIEFEELKQSYIKLIENQITKNQ